MKLVFVSSTFKDMQFERDLLQTYAIPTLNGQLREYGEKAYFGDLRWGVNTTNLDSDEGSRKVLKVCLDQIDNCKPYMIVLIGERYGWIPAQELIDEACVLKGIDKINDISVTELEIDYGALLNPEYEGRILFYFRNLDKSGMTADERRDYEAESEVHQKKVAELKKRISEIYPEHIRYYDAVWDAETKKVTGLDSFLNQVQSDLGDVLLRDLEAENNLPWQERSMQAAHRYFEETNKSLVSINAYDIAYVGSNATEEANFIYVSGEEGSGKSAAVITGYCADESEKLAFSFGLDKFSRNSFDFERILIYKLEEILEYEHKSYEDDCLDETVLQYLSLLKEPIGIYVDNAGEDFLQFLSRIEMDYRNSEETININALFMIAVQKNLPFYPFFELSANLIMGNLSAEDSGKILDSIVKSNHKELSDVVKARILSKANSCSAAYLKNIVKRLMILDSEDFAAIRAMGDGMDNINKYMISIVDDTADGRYEILGELIDEAKDRINRVFVEQLMGIFTHTPVGLSIEDIRGIFTAYGWEFNDLDFSLAVQMLEDVLSYSPDSRLYKIKNKTIESSIYKSDIEWDAIPTAEYMLKNKDLRPYAFRAAVLDAEPKYLCSVLARSEITDITDSIRCLIERGLKEKAIELLVAVAENEDFGNVKLLPVFSDLKSEEHTYVLQFFAELADACNKRLTKDALLLLELDLNARFAVAEYILNIDPRITINMLIEADELLRQYATKMDVAVINRMYFLMLKAVNKTKSQELFDEYICGEEYLSVFRYTDEYDETILKMKVFTEFSEIVDVFDGELADTYREKAKALATITNIADCKQEDFVYISKHTEDIYWLILGKAFYPFDLELLRSEVKLNITDRDANSNDTMEKAFAIWNTTNTLSDCVIYWRTILYHLMRMNDNDEELDEELVEKYISLTAYLNEQEMNIADYVDIIPFAMALDYVDDIENLLGAARNDGELETIVQNMIRYYFIEEDMEKLFALKNEFYKIRDAHMGAERIATLFIEEYLAILTEDE